jgi:hypothetical protein
VDHPKVVDPERFVTELVRRVEELARKSSEGRLTSEEYDEYSKLVRLNDALSELMIESEVFWKFINETGGLVPSGSFEEP